MLFRALAILCLIWGFNFVVMKTANFYFSPELFVTYRFGLGAIVLVAVAIFSKLPKQFFCRQFFKFRLERYCVSTVLDFCLQVWFQC